MQTMRKRKRKAIDGTMSRAFENYRPPEDLTVSQWAAKYRVLSRESSAEAGPWRNERTPYMVEPMDAITDPAVRHITVVASSQVGKSELELNAIGYIIDQDPRIDLVHRAERSTMQRSFPACALPLRCVTARG